ncbi:MAG: prephenate dehydrogenase [Gallionellales bacterium 35-53-114]|jgi:prephenate dehydrogenase|nr:MAG: prephenate dehydrogenase [Gallionellales bacterium 35-53-114]OYZ65336.1 MAG: prephenate dehydrogenase [Gallionellales bacterium 24-53-125]OZB08243.1 MAG: prephenate dehydrogenase [Gallionellales bacterium 39-52-133]HQS58173.1 prephenate dehydrogenase/arogenate dehydrogenase family protein [Gallionellaceae bacterium]HQS73728.1 prephenate dehydrogenase/arogenate dehydrogenase family protein [Gallionellaceae bacterium]
METAALRKVVIFGVGLIGGSFALALRKANAVTEVVGFGRSAATLQQALQFGLIDRIGDDVAREVRDADLVLLATPVAQMADILARIKPHLGSNTLITDGGSTKCDVVAAARQQLGSKIAQFIPAHPIAGAELSGPAAALADLYQGKKVVLTPLPENSPAAVARVRAAWQACGALVSELTPEQHDEVFAAVSHLPHLLAFTLVHDLAQRDNRELLLSFAASGFRDFTRIAASSPEMWRDISLANRDALLREIEQYAAELYKMHQALQQRDAGKLEEMFSLARKVRSAWTPQ